MNIGSCVFPHMGKTGGSAQALPHVWEVHAAAGEEDKLVGPRNNILWFPLFRWPENSNYPGYFSL